MSYEKLREKYYITEEDTLKMCELRRKWAFDDFVCEINDNGDDFYFNLTDQQVENILAEYLERRVYDRGDYELSVESEDMWDSIHRVVGYPEDTQRSGEV